MQSLRILLVEDEPLIALDLEDILVEAGHAVVGIAATTTQALTIAAGSAPFDLAILDIDLASGDDGVATASRLRREYGVDALFVSAMREEEERALSLEWKPIAFIGKPYLPRHILSALRSVEKNAPRAPDRRSNRAAPKYE